MWASYYVIVHGDRDRGKLYWTGFDRKRREHTFSNKVDEAIRFVREIDAKRAGVRLTHGIRVEVVNAAA